ncbi:MAG TPA: hypothetical protein VI997_09810 [Candidatus Thermoplasmatota archaeon]|nr:hypothetical protein [Candidatus Thermoplasmatota archaeon]
MRVPTVAIALALLALAFPTPAAANHSNDTFEAEGDLSFGAVVVEPTASVTLPTWAPGHILSITGESLAPHDLDVYFFNGATELATGCASEAADETCGVPTGATRAAVHLFYGQGVHWTLTVASAGTAACADGVDNDGDLLVDFPEDAGCASEIDTSEAGAGLRNFNDGRYHEIGLFAWDTASLDVLIVPPASAGAALDPVSVDPLGRLAAVEQSVAAWKSGIDALGAAWLTDGLTIDVYTVGFDTIPAAALADPEIVIVAAEYNPFLLLGIGFSPADLACGSNPFTDSANAATPGAIGEDALHSHGASPWGVTMCRTAVDNVCFVIDTNPAFGEVGFDASGDHLMYDLNAHEFGHCLGIGHVGDAGDFRSTTFPTRDVMSYQSTPSQVHCVSNLNLRAMEGMFARVLDRPQAEWLEPLRDVSMATSQYVQVACANP